MDEILKFIKLFIKTYFFGYIVCIIGIIITFCIVLFIFYNIFKENGFL